MDSVGTIEGDLKLTPSQNETRETRAAIKINLWTRGELVYDIDPALGESYMMSLQPESGEFSVRSDSK